MKNNIVTPEYNCNGIFLRKIRSFVCRKGRITKSQINAIKKYWLIFGINFQLKPLNFLSVFHRYAPIVLEIGFGSGKSLVQNAIDYPDKDFLGIEVYRSGIGSCLHLAHSSRLKNLKIIYYDAIEVINTMIIDHTLSTVQVFFPDPWNKKRHHKRRLLNSSFFKIISKKLIIDGILHIATDSKEYAMYILDEIQYIDNYINLSKKNDFVQRPISRIITKFEKKAYFCGKNVFDLTFKLKI